MDDLDLRDVLVGARRLEGEKGGKGVDGGVSVNALETKEVALDPLFGISVEGGLVFDGIVGGVF